MEQFSKFYNSWPGTILFALVITLFVRFYIAQPFIVRGESMEPNFDDGDYLIVDELSYAVREPKRGEVVVFHFPKDKKQFFIKRIIGLPGETVNVYDGRVEIIKNGETLVLNEDYLDSRYLSYTEPKVFALNQNEYVVLGDNRASSSDSRSWGILDEKLIVGRALIRLWPPKTVSIIKTAESTAR